MYPLSFHYDFANDNARQWSVRKDFYVCPNVINPR